MIDQARKRGPFDLRYPARQTIAASGWELQDDGDGPVPLEWSGFLARVFPNRRRHDLEALTSFEAYRAVLDPRILARSDTGVTGQSAFGSARLTDWESEGGASGATAAAACRST
jgi:hypothetical protein